MDSTKVLREAMTAYEAVYNQDLRVELEEKQVFENWVNSLVEEGYDLSEYTWEDMYGIYVSEDIKSFANRGGLLGAATRAISRSGTDAGKAQNRAAVGRFFSGINQGASKLMQTGGVLGRGGVADRMTGKVAAKPPATSAPKPANEPYKSRFAGARDKAFSAAQNIKGSPVVGSKPVPTQTQNTQNTGRTQPQKPTAAPAAKPAPTASATPSSATPAAPKRTFNPLMQKTFGYQTGYAPSQVKGDIKKMAQMGSLKAGFDLFDVVKGHLLDEGYADTEEAALAIMANMSEEWRETIISEAVKGESPERRKALAAERKSGVKPLSAKEGEKYASHKISQMAHAKRRRMGDDD